MSLTNFKNDLKNGPNSNFLMTQPGFKISPPFYSYSSNIIDDDLNSPVLKVLFNIYINYENYYAINISYEKVSKELNSVSISFSNEVFYEYGNEENTLANKQNYNIFHNEEELLLIIKEKLKIVESTYGSNTFKDLYKDFLFSFNKLKEDPEFDSGKNIYDKFFAFINYKD